MTAPRTILSLTLEGEPGLETTSDPLEFWKEVIYECPKFQKDNLQFSVNKALIDHWAKTGKEMLAEGIEHPLPLDHTSNPEKRRGSVIDLEPRQNPKRGGIWSLYEKVRFRDAEAARLAQTANVSILVDEEMTSGRGTRYKLPIIHTALTDYPVIPGLEPFQAVALSYNIADPGSQAMTLQELATKMGLNPQLPPDQILAAIAAAWDQMKAKTMAPPAPPGAPPAGPPGTPRPPGLSDPPVEEEDEDEEDEDEDNVKPKEPEVSLALVELSRDNRLMKIEKLVLARKITPAVRKDLEKRFCTPNALKLSLSRNDGTDDGFKAIIETLQLNEPVFELSKGKTGLQQAVALSQTAESDPRQSPLVKNADKRAAQPIK